MEGLPVPPPYACRGPVDFHTSTLSSQWFPSNMLPYGSVYSRDLFKASAAIAALLFIPY